jgi:hypothetical protein
MENFMETTPLLLIVLILVILLLLFLLLLPRIRKLLSATPDSSLAIQVIPHPFGFRRSPDNRLNEQIVEAVNRMGGVGDDAEANYQAALNTLRQNAAEVVSIITSEYRDLPENQHLDRWSLIQLLTELRHPASLPVLNEILSSRIPPERSNDPHSFTTVGEEVMIRTTAVEALTQISADENREALELLLRHTRHENFSVKRACIQGYLASGGENALQTLLEVLPESDRFILNIRRADVRDVPQPRGENYLIRPEADRPPRISSSNRSESSG